MSLWWLAIFRSFVASSAVRCHDDDNELDDDSDDDGDDYLEDNR